MICYHHLKEGFNNSLTQVGEAGPLWSSVDKLTRMYLIHECVALFMLDSLIIMLITNTYSVSTINRVFPWAKAFFFYVLNLCCRQV